MLEGRYPAPTVKTKNEVCVHMGCGSKKAHEGRDGRTYHLNLRVNWFESEMVSRRRDRTLVVRFY